MKTIDIVYFNAGGGHRAAATALEDIFHRQCKPYNIRLVNLFDMIDPTGLFKKATGMQPEDIYNKRLELGWTLGLTQELAIFQLVISMGHSLIVEQLKKHWNKTKPDMVISVIPNFNRSMRTATQGIPYVTILTDFADYPSHFWIEPNQDQHFICGTPKAGEQAKQIASPGSTIHEVSGMIIRPDFYITQNIDRDAEMQKVGLNPKMNTGVVMFGGHGSKMMYKISRLLEDTQLILICGHNEKLAKKLRTQKVKAPRLIVEFTPNVKYYMSLGDFFIGKPGPGSISEAIHQKLPVIVTKNFLTLPQEEYNADWVVENNVGIVLKSFNTIKDGVAKLCTDLLKCKERTSTINNQAIFEIPVIIDKIFKDKI